MSGKIEISRELAERLLNFTCNEEYDELRDLLASPVVERQPVAVVLPEQKQEVRAWGHDMGGNYDEGHADGWNACLDKVRELNQ